MSQAVSAQDGFKLAPARLDLTTTKTQLVIACIVSGIAAITVFATTIRIGFIGNDFTVVHSVAAATEGGAPAFAQSLNNQTIINLGYGPLGLAWLMLGQFFFGAKALCFHALNIALFALCTLLVIQLGSLLCGRLSNRLAPSAGLWAGLLYAVHPVHAPVVASAVGSVDLLCELLILLTVFSFLRLRCLREPEYLLLGLLAFGCAAFVKVQACTVPIVIALAEALLFRRDSMPSHKRIFLPATFFMALALISTCVLILPVHMPVSLVGIQPENTIALLGQPSTWQQLLGFNSDSSPFLFVLTAIAYVAGLGLLIARLCKRTAPWNVPLWVLLWLVLSLVADSSFLEAPPLVAQRCLFFATAPLSILVAIACLPAMDVMVRRWSDRLTAAGTLLLVTLFGCYFALLSQQIQIWNELSSETQSVLDAVVKTCQHLPPGKGVLVGELPPDLSGDWVRYAFLPPFREFNHIAEGIPPRVVENNNIWPQLMLSTMESSNCGAIFRWDAHNGPTMEWSKPEGSATFSLHFDATTAQPLSIVPASEQKLSSVRGQGAPLQVIDNAVHVHGGSAAQIIWLTAAPINPLKADAAQIDMRYAGAGKSNAAADSQVKIIWEAGTIGNGRRQTGSASILHKDQADSDSYLVWLGRYPNWTLNNSVLRLGLSFAPGNYDVTLKNINLVSHAVLTPSFSLNSGGKMNSASPWTVLFTPQSAPTLKFDITHMPEANGTRISIWDERAQFLAKTESQLYDLSPSNGIRPAFHGDFIVRQDAVILSPELFNLPGVYYARAVALDKNDHPIGLPTEPLSFRFKRQ